MTRKKKINLFKPTFWALTFALFAGSIFMAVDASTAGAEITYLATQVEALSAKNRELTAEMIKFSSVKGAEESAETLGFVKPEKTVYLTPEAGVFARLPTP